MPTDKLIIENGVVTGFCGEEANLVIPEGVTEIGEGAFKNCLWLNSVTIESSVFRTIGDNAFKNCCNLHSVTIKVLRGAIGAYAFDHCEQLESLKIPSGAMEICEWAFNACFNLNEVIIPSSVMVIANTAFNTLLCPKLLILCAPNTEAARFAEKGYIPCRQDTYEVHAALKSAREARCALETRVFDLFRQKITAPNSLALHVNVPKFYADKKDAFFNEIFKCIPENMTVGGNSSKIVQLMDATIGKTILRLEGYGVFANRSRINRDIFGAYSQLATLINSLSDYREELVKIAKSNLDSSQEELLREAESRVTGLSYGVIGDALTMAAYAVDDYRERQKQRKQAYAAAEWEYNKLEAQVKSEVEKAYKNTLIKHFKPTFRSASDNFLEALRDVEIHMLKEYGLLEEIEEGTYNAKKSAEIIERADGMDKEYAAGLALKMYPLNTDALVFAGRNNLATDELLDYIYFMQITDTTAINQVLHSTKVTTKKLLEAYKKNRFSDVYRRAFLDRCNSIRGQIESLLNAEYQNMSAYELQQQVESIIDAETWNAVCTIEQLVSDKFLFSIKKQVSQVNAAESYQNLGQYIAEFHAGQLDADKLASKIIGLLDWKIKVEKAYEIKDILGKDRITKLLSKDLDAAATKLLREGLPVFNGHNESAIKSKIQRNLAEQWEEKIVCYVKEMGVPVLSVKLTDLPVKLTAMYIENEQRRLANLLQFELKENYTDFAAAFERAHSYTATLPLAQLKSILLPYCRMVQNYVDAFQKNPIVPADATLDESKEIAQAVMDGIMTHKAWDMYRSMETQYNSFFSNIQKAVEQEIQYREACAAYEKASKLISFQEAYRLFTKVNVDFKDCKDRKEACDRKIKELEKKAKTKKNIITAVCLFAVAVVIVLWVTVFIPNSQYNNAIALMSAEKYTEAISVFEDLDGYKDSNDKITACNMAILDGAYNDAIALMESGAYEEAIVAFEAVEGYKDSKDKINGCNTAILDGKYSEAITLMDAERYNEAISVFKALKGYSDSVDKISACKYAIAVELMEKEEYVEAIATFEVLGEYNDSLNKADTCKEIMYNKALDLMDIGKYHEAAIAFAHTNNYKDAKSKSDALWETVAARDVISTGFANTVGLTAKGTVLAVGYNKFNQCDVSNWYDIVAVSAAGNHTVGLKSNGTVVAVGNNDDGQCAVSGWSDIVAISAAGNHTVGLTTKGKVIAVGSNGFGQCNVSDWTNIVSISAGDGHTVGLKSTGTVVAVGDNYFLGQCNVSDWTNIVSISAGDSYTLGLRSDGTVVAVGSNTHGQCDVSKWRDIVAVSAGGMHTVGLMSNRTVVTVGNNDSGQREAAGWENIKVPN